jgi:hypothetical protein
MWLICRVAFKGRKRALMSPGRYTELFFLDEAVALAAGHRPCGECRRAECRSYIEAVNEDNDKPLEGSKDLDRRLNKSRRAPRMLTPVAGLPDGAFVTLGDDDFRLVWNGDLYRWTPEGYVDQLAMDAVGFGTAAVVTPSVSVAALRHGYPVEVHASATQPGARPDCTPDHAGGGG